MLLLGFLQSILAFCQVTLQLITLSLDFSILYLRFLELSFALCNLLFKLDQCVFKLLDATSILSSIFHATGSRKGHDLTNLYFLPQLAIFSDKIHKDILFNFVAYSYFS